MRQLTILSAGFLALVGLQWIARESGVQALANARRLLSIEQALGLDLSRASSDLASRHPGLSTTFDAVHVWAAWPIPIATLTYTWFRRRRLYYLCRNTMLISGIAGSAIMALVPVAPPRILNAAIDQRPSQVFELTSVAGNLQGDVSILMGWVALSCLALASTREHERLEPWLAALALLLSVTGIMAGAYYTLELVAVFGVTFAGLVVAAKANPPTGRSPERARPRRQNSSWAGSKAAP